MRAISASMTKAQVRDRSKTETRRLGWLHARAGMRLRVVEKCMGLRKGEKLKELAIVEIVEVRREPLNRITQEAVIREGFPNWTPAQFIEFFCKAMRREPKTPVTVIRWRYIESEAPHA